MRRISVFGATGSIGENTLDLLVPGEVAVVALSGGRQVERLAEQAQIDARQHAGWRGAFVGLPARCRGSCWAVCQGQEGSSLWATAGR
jgi:1-deoxy-D-xylulose 5-phosphate reductoisomerase